MLINLLKPLKKAGLSSYMDKIAERLSLWFGSTAFIALHVMWVAVWALLKLDKELLVYLMTIEGIFLVLFVLRAENVQANRMEKSIKADLKKSNEVIALLKQKRTIKRK